jgi:hypothetical protein
MLRYQCVLVSTIVLARRRALNLPPDAPATVKRELNAILDLQGNLDMVDIALRATLKMFEDSASAGVEARCLVDGLSRTHERLKSKVDSLYASLNIHAALPELKGISCNFIHTLFLAHDLKINIRKRAIGSFFEWDRLDQAVGGHHPALGM